MEPEEERRRLRNLYRLTVLFGILGFVSYVALSRPVSALGFVLGALVSLGNLWLFEWLARSISPSDAPRKPWSAAAFAGRYLIFFTFGYVIVKALGVNPLAVVLGLFANTAAVLVSSTVEIVQSFFPGRRTH